MELNILDIDGHLDLNDELLGELDYAIASMHAQNYNSGTIAENTCFSASLIKFISSLEIPHVFFNFSSQFHHRFPVY